MSKQTVYRNNILRLIATGDESKFRGKVWSTLFILLYFFYGNARHSSAVAKKRDCFFEFLREDFLSLRLFISGVETVAMREKILTVVSALLRKFQMRNQRLVEVYV